MFIKLNMYYYYYNITLFNAIFKTRKHSPKPVLVQYLPVFYFTAGMFVEVWAVLLLELCHAY